MITTVVPAFKWEVAFVCKWSMPCIWGLRLLVRGRLVVLVTIAIVSCGSTRMGSVRVSVLEA